MRTHVGNDQLREVHDTDTGPRLGRPERVASPVIVKLAGNPHGARVEVDVIGTERGEFRPAETSEGSQQDQRPVA